VLFRSLERSGDVIPHVSEVVDRSKRTGSSVPKTCPACGGEVKKDGANVFCHNEECEGKAFRVVKSWVTKRNIKYLGSELLLELYQNHDVKLPQDLYRLTEEYLSNVKRGVGRVGSASKLIMSEINKSLTCPLSEFFGSLCIKFLGRRQCEIMIEAGINTFDKFMDLTVEQLSQVPGFSSDGVKAGTVVAGIKAAKPTVDALVEAGVVVREPAAVGAPVSGLAMSGKVVCFTGVRPKPLEQAQFLELGGVVKDSMSKAVTHLVVKDPNTASNKAEKARSLGITLVAYTEWVKWLGE
jgi:DNA ligase (NAD+)